MPALKWSVVTLASAVGCTWFVVRLLIELVFPMVPFQTHNSFLRLVVEIPFYYAVEWAYLDAVEWPYFGILPEPWGETVGVAVLEAVSVGCIAGLIYAFARRRSRSGVLPVGHCTRCGYNLQGNVSGTCPECGTPIRGLGARPEG